MLRGRWVFLMCWLLLNGLMGTLGSNLWRALASNGEFLAAWFFAFFPLWAAQFLLLRRLSRMEGRDGAAWIISSCVILTTSGYISTFLWTAALDELARLSLRLGSVAITWAAIGFVQGCLLRLQWRSRAVWSLGCGGAALVGILAEQWLGPTSPATRLLADAGRWTLFGAGTAIALRMLLKRRTAPLPLKSAANPVM
jgi:hypothetical protein